MHTSWHARTTRFTPCDVQTNTNERFGMHRNALIISPLPRPLAFPANLLYEAVSAAAAIESIGWGAGR